MCPVEREVEANVLVLPTDALVFHSQMELFIPQKSPDVVYCTSSLQNFMKRFNGIFLKSPEKNYHDL